jgi:uncharacterized protein (TIGR02145 family)
MLSLCVGGGLSYYFMVMRPARTAPDIQWYVANPKAETFSISTAEELAMMARIVNGTWEYKPENGNFVQETLDKVFSLLDKVLVVTGKTPKRNCFAGKTVNLTASVDLSEYGNWVPIGDYSASPANVFHGTFNGGGHVISGLAVNRPDTDYQGLFGCVGGMGKVENIRLEGVDVRGRGRVGAIAGIVDEGGSITNGYSSGTVSGTAMVGGIVGAIAAAGSAANSYSVAAVSGDSAVGGVVGSVGGKSMGSGRAMGIFTDARDGQRYRWVETGGNGRKWMADNLNHAADNSWCYGNDSANCAIYGRLYSWNAAMGACPAGWRLPTRTDWNDWVLAAGGASVAGKRFKSAKGWNDDGGGTDELTFSALPSGYFLNGAFHSLGFYGGWWSATGSEGDNAYYQFVSYDNDLAQEAGNANKSFGMAVRCVQFAE